MENPPPLRSAFGKRFLNESAANRNTMRKPYPENMTLEARKALDIFTDEEAMSLIAFYDDSTSEFLGIGFVNEYGKWSKFADKTKAEALIVLEEEYRKELEN